MTYSPVNIQLCPQIITVTWWQAPYTWPRYRSCYITVTTRPKQSHLTDQEWWAGYGVSLHTLQRNMQPFFLLHVAHHIQMNTDLTPILHHRDRRKTVILVETSAIYGGCYIALHMTALLSLLAIICAWNLTDYMDLSLLFLWVAIRHELCSHSHLMRSW